MNITIFKNFNEIVHQLPLSTMLEYIRHGRYKDKIEVLRKLIAASDKKEFDNQKKSLPAFTPSASFEGGRKMEFLKVYSGIVILDFDKLSESQMTLVSQKAPAIPYTFALFKSPSGKGFKVLVKTSATPSDVSVCTNESSAINNPVSAPGSPGGNGWLENIKYFHLSAFTQVCTYYENTLALHADPSGKDITRLCFVSYDPQLYFNPDASLFEVNLSAPQNSKVSNTPTLSDDIENVICQIESLHLDITTPYDNWLKLCFALIEALGSSARDAFHRISRFNPDYNSYSCDRQFDNCLNSNNSGITIKTFFGIAKDHGITISKKSALKPSPFRPYVCKNK